MTGTISQTTSKTMKVEQLRDSENLRALPFALVGAMQGIFRYYVKPPIVGFIGSLVAREPEAWEDRFFHDK